jgi:hypothetical protein
MQFLSLEPFIPSGTDFDMAKQFFQELDFTVNWDAGDYVGFERDGCKFILQNVRISNADEFWQEVTDKQLPETFGIRLSKPTDQPYGREVNVIDLAGVCWHFVS